MRFLIVKSKYHVLAINIDTIDCIEPKKEGLEIIYGNGMYCVPIPVPEGITPEEYMDILLRSISNEIIDLREFPSH